MYYILADHALWHTHGEQLLLIAAALGVPTALWKLGWIKRPVEYVWRHLIAEPMNGWGSKVVSGVVEEKMATAVQNQEDIKKTLDDIHACIDRRSAQTHAAIDKLTAYAEEVLAEAVGAKERIRHLYRSLDIPVFETDARGFSTYVNPALVSIMGISAEDAMGEGWIGTIHPDDRDRTAHSWENAVENGIDFSAIFRIKNVRTGVDTQVKSVARPLRDSRQNIVGWVGTLDYVVDGD